MGVRTNELLTVPGVLSLSRVLLALLFPAGLQRAPGLALAMLAVAGLTDVLDGWFARHVGRTTAAGAVLDPIADKVFVVTVIVSLFAFEWISPAQVLLLGAREALQLPLAAWLSVSGRARARASALSANRLGKVTTCLQFGTLVVVLVRGPYLQVWLSVTALVGAMAGMSYWRRAVAEPSS